MSLFVVRCSAFPTAEQNANPFVGQGTNDRVILLALFGVVSEVVVRPDRFAHRESGELMKGLSHKFGASLAAIDDFGLAAAFGHRRDPGEVLDVQGSIVAVAIGAEGDQKPRSQGWSSSRQMAEQFWLRMLLKDLLNFFFVLVNNRIESLDHLRVHLAQAYTTFHNGQICGESLRLLGYFQDVLNVLGTADVMAVEESFDGARLGLLKRPKSGPFFQEIRGQLRSDVAAQHLERLGKILL